MNREVIPVVKVELEMMCTNPGCTWEKTAMRMKPLCPVCKAKTQYKSQMKRLRRSADANSTV